MKVALIGATGMVGNIVLQVLEERNFPITALFLVASKKDIGKEIIFKGSSYTIISIEDAIHNKPFIFNRFCSLLKSTISNK